jgi:hypothetical protein
MALGSRFALRLAKTTTPALAMNTACPRACQVFKILPLIVFGILVHQEAVQTTTCKTPNGLLPAMWPPSAMQRAAAMDPLTMASKNLVGAWRNAAVQLWVRLVCKKHGKAMPWLAQKASVLSVATSARTFAELTMASLAANPVILPAIRRHLPMAFVIRRLRIRPA